MTIDVSTILKELGGKIDINGDVEMSDTDFLGEMYHFNEPVKAVSYTHLIDKHSVYCCLRGGNVNSVFQWVV